ncbi:MAG: arginine--tRNA ligase [Parcubacteria group bacterium CG_4_9_14_0_2_um_filter_41_8]|nr:MAG: arginine--tRNA ligase [Parcubacteria group bacterium CG_4_9_14_0_2_um_filter_41_8]
MVIFLYMIKQKIAEKIKKAFKKEFNIALDEVDLSYPESQFGDFSVSCHKFAKDLKMSPQEIAQKLSETLKDKLIAKTEAIAGYLNIFVDSGMLSKEVLSDILNQENAYGSSKITKQKIVLEYSSPNTNKPLHLGHARNNMLGMSLSCLLESQGAEVIKTQIINDRGIHIMKSLVAYQKLGNNETPESAGMKGDHFVGKYYVLFDEETMMDEAQEALRKWEAGDAKVVKLWEQMNKWVYEGYEDTYRDLGSEFDKDYYESEIYKSGKEIVAQGILKDVFKKEEDGSVSINLEDIDLDKKILQRADGTSIYITQDLALAVERQKEFKADSLIYVVGQEQEYHFKVLFEILKRLGYEWAKNLRHLSYGLVFLPEGKMKSREGKVVDADDIIAEVEDLAAKEIKKRFPEISDAELGQRSDAIGLGALKFMLLRVTPSQAIHFDPKEAISFEGSTGPYVQYVFARISSILENMELPEIDDVDFSLLAEKEEKELVLKLMQYPEVLSSAAENYNPSALCNYLLELSQIFNSFYHKHSVLKAEGGTVRDARLCLIASARIVLKNGLNILGIEAVSKM